MYVKLVCAKCDNEFAINTTHLRSIGLNQIPAQCPNCADKCQKRTPQNTVVSRKMIQEFNQCSIAIPDEWFKEFQSSDRDSSCRRATVKGSIGKGADWSGRIDIYDFRYDQEAVGRLRLMEVEHEKGVIDEKGSEHPKTYQYLSIDPEPSAIAPLCALVFASAHYKTTKKGFGRQFHVEQQDKSLWSYSLSSSCRSGRFGDVMKVGVVDDIHPIILKNTGDFKLTKIWSLSYPTGKELF